MFIYIIARTTTLGAVVNSYASKHGLVVLQMMKFVSAVSCLGTMFITLQARSVVHVTDFTFNFKWLLRRPSILSSPGAPHELYPLKSNKKKRLP